MWNWLWFFCVPWMPSAMMEANDYERWGHSVDRWAPIVELALDAYGIPEEFDTFMRVMHCESRGDPNAHNTFVYDNPKDQASGLMQHMPRWWDDRAKNAGFEGYSPFDPVANIFTSAWLLTTRGGGWAHWSCYDLDN